MKNITMNIINDHNYFKTSDLALATAISLWFPVAELVREDGSSKIEFAFEYNEEIEELVQEYWKGNLSVDPQRYFQQLKILKTRIHSGQ